MSAAASAFQDPLKTPRDNGAPRWIAIAAVAVFLVYALNFLYYFVDDEAIPYVFAQNVLHGKGLSYNGVEGRVEGYSDFLYVWIATVFLTVQKLAGLPKIAVFFAGKALSFLCGVAIVLLAWHIMRRIAVPRAGTAAGLATLALAGPLAVWSCSALEAVPFALIVTTMIAALIFESDVAAAVAASLLVLLRIDGFIYAAILIAAFMVIASGPRRRRIMSRILLPSVVVLATYHAWRVWYFGDLLPAPLEAKILYKLIPHPSLMIKEPDRSYLSGFINVYGWWTAAGPVGAAGYALWVGGVARALSLAALPLVLYVGVVGDWMFGFRFFVALLPVFALIIGLSVGTLSSAWPRAAGVVSLVWIAGMGSAAERFVETYTEALSLPSFLHAPSRDLHVFFRPYYGFYETVRPLIPPGAITAYNQAGLVPFLLDLNNIDDFGICSRFYASLPSTDVYFTEGGRYAPLTNKPRLRVHQAYLVYRDVQYILSGTDILRRANGDVLPSGLFGDYYRLARTDAPGDFAVYRRTEKPADAYAGDARTFVENLAHVSYLRNASIDGVQIDRRQYSRQFPFLRDGTANLQFTGGVLMDLQFAARDETVQAISIFEVRTTERAALNVTLLSAAGGIVQKFSVPMDAGQARSVVLEPSAGASASRLIVEFSAGRGVVAWARINDLRVEGQTPALEGYLARHLGSGSGRRLNTEDSPSH
jgi:hypothetical protein